MIIDEPRWIKWATFSNSGPVLKDDAPEFIRKEFEEYQERVDEYNENQNIEIELETLN